MAVVKLADLLVGKHNRRIGYLDVPLQASINTITKVTGSEFDSREWDYIAIEVLIATNDTKWWVRGSNDPTFTNYESVITGAPVTVGTGGASIHRFGGYNHTADQVTCAEYDYYYLAIQSNVADAHGSATIKIRGWRI